jgi:energy-coupling factor transporter ATP-binding protein EcfA2
LAVASSLQEAEEEVDDDSSQQRLLLTKAQNPLFVPKHPDTVKRREELWEALANIGYLRWKNRDNGRSYRWKEGLSRMELIAQLDKMETPQDFYLEILASYDRHAFNPFREITIDSRNRIIVLTGANSNGKSTLMRSIAVALNTAMTGRKIQAEEAEMSLCDGIFHDFNVHNNVRKGVSRFRAQVRRVMAFLKDGTPHSLGLFDEMFHGTSSLYLLSLAWATLEEFSKRNLRAIVSTHESLLTFCTQSGGLEHLRGTYARQKKIVGGDTGGGIDGVTAMSLRNHFELRPGPVMDSDALRVAQEEGMPEGTLQRADSIKNMLMGEPDFTE